MTQLVIAHLPNHGPSATPAVVDRMLHRDFDSAGSTECYQAVPALRRRNAITTITGDGPTRRDRYGRVPSWDNPILLPRGHVIVAHGSVRVSAAYLPNLKWNPARWLVWVAYRPRPDDDTVVCHITVHPTVRIGLQRKALRHLRAAIKVARSRGWIPVATGDLQTGDTKPRPAGPARERSLRPADIFAASGMDVAVRHLDWIAWDRHALALADLDIVEPRDLPPGEDHPWLYATLRFLRRG